MDNEKIQVLRETVDAVKELSEPHRKAFVISSVVHTIIHIAMAILLGMMIHYAYMAPEEASVTHEQIQDYNNQVQSNNTSTVVTDGK